PGGGRPGRLIGEPLRWLLLSIAVGALGFINAWDLGFAAALIFIAVTVKMYRDEMMALQLAALRGLATTALAMGPGLAIFSGFYFGTFSSQVDWGAPLGAAEYVTRPIHMLTVWGMFVVLLAPLWLTVSGRVSRAYAARIRPVRSAGSIIDQDGDMASDASVDQAGSEPNSWADTAPATAALLAIVFPFVLWAIIHLYTSDSAVMSDLLRRVLDVLPLAVLSGLAMLALFYFGRRSSSDTLVFALALLAMALYMVYGAELLYINDLFGGRMNTVFKLYYQVWILLGVIGAYGVHFWIRNHGYWSGFRRSASETGAVIAAVMLIGAMYYPLASLDSRTDGFSRELTLDGTAFIARWQPSEGAAIKWLSENARVDAVLVEAVGGSYTEFGRISSSTGIPTVIGWPFHEEQWRGDRSAFAGREAEVAGIYSMEDIEEVRAILRRYEIDYIVIGPRERSTYPDIDLDRFEQIGERVFSTRETNSGPRDYVIFDVGGR
ncbi:MAG: DUF2298 domain-containing protein, partial [Dehalococcoidia bacterium]|nr:DUF2298 domain-containing protein [Dehalococcoidia bacterium]